MVCVVGSGLPRVASNVTLQDRKTPMPRRLTRTAATQERRQTPRPAVEVARPVDLRATALFRMLALASRFTAQFTSVYTSRFALGLPEWRTLALLGWNGAMPAARIAQLAAIDRGLVSRSVAALEAGGFVRRVDHPTDGRTQVVALTARGASLHDQIADLHQRRQDRLLAGFSAQERAALLEFLTRLDTALDDLIARPVRIESQATVRSAQRSKLRAGTTIKPARSSTPP